MSRVPSFSKDELSPFAQRVYDEIVATRGDVDKPFQILLTIPPLLERVAQLGAYVRYDSNLLPEIRECVVLATAREMSCEYEWAAHEAQAVKAGLREETVRAIRDGAMPSGASDEELVVRFVLENLRLHAISDATFHRVLDRFGIVGTTEIAATAGYYAMLANVINAFEDDSENDAPPTPIAESPKMPKSTGKRLVFVGAGAVGSFVGGMLASAGEDVTLIDGWPEHIARIKARGLLVSGTQGKRTAPVKALHVHEVQRLSRSPMDIAFITAKAYDTEWAAALIKDYLSAGAYMVSLQNGFNEERIAGIAGRANVVGCIASTLGVEIVGPGHVTRAYRPGGEGHEVFRVGEMDGEVTDRVSEVVDLLKRVDSATATDNLIGERWSKLVANSMANPLSAITGLRDRQMSQSPEVRGLALRLGAEAVAVGLALGYALPPVFGIEAQRWEAATVEPLDRALAKAAERATDQGRPSTPLDIELGRRTELDFFNGLVIARGRELGIRTPTHQSVLHLAKRVERGELKPALDNLRYLREVD